MMVGVAEADLYLAASRGELEGIGEYVHEHLVEVVAVYPYRQLFVVVLECEAYLLGKCLLLK